jgi:hypothetical protein
LREYKYIPPTKVGTLKTVNVLAAQPPPPAPPFRQYHPLGAATPGFPTFMNSGGSIKGLPTICVLGGLVRTRAP